MLPKINWKEAWEQAAANEVENLAWAAITSPSIPTGPISTDDLQKAMDKMSELKEMKKWHIIVLDDYFKEFTESCLSKLSCQATNDIPFTHFSWLKITKLDVYRAYPYAYELMKEWVDEVYIISRGQIMVLGAEFFSYINSITNAKFTNWR